MKLQKSSKNFSKVLPSRTKFETTSPIVGQIIICLFGAASGKLMQPTKQSPQLTNSKIIAMTHGSSLVELVKPLRA